MFWEDTCRECFDVEKVNTIEVNKDDKDKSDKYSEGNSTEKMPKKNRKFVPIENDHKGPELASEPELFGSKRDGLEEKSNGDEFEKELVQLNGDGRGEQNDTKLEK